MRAPTARRAARARTGAARGRGQPPPPPRARGTIHYCGSKRGCGCRGVGVSRQGAAAARDRRATQVAHDARVSVLAQLSHCGNITNHAYTCACKSNSSCHRITRDAARAHLAARTDSGRSLQDGQPRGATCLTVSRVASGAKTPSRWHRARRIRHGASS